MTMKAKQIGPNQFHIFLVHYVYEEMDMGKSFAAVNFHYILPLYWALEGGLHRGLNRTLFLDVLPNLIMASSHQPDRSLL